MEWLLEKGLKKVWDGSGCGLGGVWDGGAWHGFRATDSKQVCATLERIATFSYKVITLPVVCAGTIGYAPLSTSIYLRGGRGTATKSPKGK